MAGISTTQSQQHAAPAGGEQKDYRFAFALITALFFTFGFITCLNDILVPHLKAMFTLNYTQAALIQFCFFTAYFVASLPSGKIVARFGYKKGTIIGTIVMGLGCLMFYPAAGMQSYPLFLCGLFVLAAGITLIQVAVNPYIAILGPQETASSRLNLAQAFNSLGTTIAPMFGSFLILAVAIKSEVEIKAMDATAQEAYRVTQASSVQGPYVGLALAIFVLAGIVALVHLPAVTGSVQKDEVTGAVAKDRESAWKYRHLVLGALGIFCYVGAEVAIGSYLVNFMGLSEIGGLAEATAAKYVSFYWGGAMVGRFIGAYVLTKIRPGKVLTFNALLAVALTLTAMVLSGQIAMGAILLIGLFNSIMFPTIFSLAIDGLGKNTAQGSGILCMAIVGGAIIPLIQGSLADTLGLHHSFVLPVLCYLYIAYYGWKGYRADAAS
jgi:FHS family L-fucose permease-like MFS transporter